MTKTQESSAFLNRRHLLKAGAALLGTGALATVITTGKEVTLPEPALAQNNMTPDEALNLLKEGNRRFVENRRQNPNQTFARITEVAEGQAPFAAILCCSDSRVPVEIVFDRGIGDLFVGRIAGNIATPEEIGSLEYGTLVLGAKVLMVLGHEHCGAVKATLEGGRNPGQIDSLVDGIQLAVERSTWQNKPGSKLENAVKANVVYQTERLQKSSVISELIEKGALNVIGAYYDLDTGRVDLL